MKKLLLPVMLTLFATLLSACGGGSGPNLPGLGVHPPAGLTYSQDSVVYTVGESIAGNAPSSSGGWITGYAVSPVLPEGLSLDPQSGVISGTPTAVTPMKQYTVAGSNSAGIVTALVQIEVTAQTLAPESLEYAQANIIYTVGVPTGPNLPKGSGGAMTQYSIEPALPAGLSMDPQTGVISGTPSAASAPASYVVTGSNSAGSVSAQVTIEVQHQVVAPAGLQYSAAAAVYRVGQTIAPNGPQASGGEITQYSVVPALPAGLSLNEESGVISGTPSAASASASYTVTGSNSAGSVTAQVTIEVQERVVTPMSLEYTHKAPIYVVDHPITPNVPHATGGQPTHYSVSPALPAGLSLNTQTGVISGTPSAVSAPVSYAVTGSATSAFTSLAVSKGSDTAVTTHVTIEVQERVVAPANLTYTQTAAIYTVGQPIAPNPPQSSGGAITQYRASPALPAGLSLNTTTGVISGTPNVAAASASYTVIGSNSAGSLMTYVTIEVQPAVTAPLSLSYSQTAIVLFAGQALTSSLPQSTGGGITQYSVSPALPAGLSLNDKTGAISGIPSAASASASYTITGSNSAGSVTARVTIEVRKPPLTAPGSLQYTQAEAVYEVGEPITENLPQSTGGEITEYSVSPALPAGLSLNTTTGVISGTPSVIGTSAEYLVTGGNAAGWVQAWVKIAVQRSQVSEWRAAAPMNEARQHHTATRLQDGRVLVTGGCGSSDTGCMNTQQGLLSAELYDPVQNKWTPAAKMSSGRAFHTATLLADGRVLVVGGNHLGSYGPHIQSSAEVYDPRHDRWTAAPETSTPRVGHTATLLPDGKVLIAGTMMGTENVVGSNWPNANRSAELYDPQHNSWAIIPDMGARRDNPAATLLADGRVLVVGGRGKVDASGLVSAEAYDATRKQWTGAGKLTARSGATATLLPNGNVLVTGGSSDQSIAAAEVYEPARSAWKTAPPMKDARFRHTATLLSDGTVLVAGGFGGDASAERYIPEKSTWASAPRLTSARGGHTATLLLDGTVLVTGGGSGIPTTIFVSAERLY